MFILRRYKSEKVAGFLWNRWPTSNGISGRNEMEWVAGFAWNHWPAWSGIRSSHRDIKPDGAHTQN